MSNNPKPKGPAPFNNPFAQLKPQGASARSKGAPGKGPPKPAPPPPPPPRKATLEEEERALFLEAVGEVEPVPQVEMRAPNLFWHAGKILYEKYWLYRRF